MFNFRENITLYIWFSVVFISRDECNCKIYREYHGFDNTSASKFVIGDYRHTILHSKNVEKRNKMEPTQFIQYPYIFTDLSSHNDENLQYILNYFPTNKKIMLQTQPEHFVWLQDFLISNNSTHRIDSVWISSTNSLQLSDINVTKIESLGISVGIYHNMELANFDVLNLLMWDTNQERFNMSNRSILARFVFGLDYYYDYDTFSRKMDEMYRTFKKETLRISAKVIVSLKVDSDIKEAYERLIARFLYTWGTNSNVQVMIESTNPFFIQQFEFFVDSRSERCCESAFININEFTNPSLNREALVPLLCSDFSNFIFQIWLEQYSKNDLIVQTVRDIEKRCGIKPSISFEVFIDLHVSSDLLVTQLTREMAQINEFYPKVKEIDLIVNTDSCKLLSSVIEKFHVDGKFLPKDITSALTNRWLTCLNDHLYTKANNKQMFSIFERKYAPTVELVGNILSAAHKMSYKVFSYRDPKIVLSSYQYYFSRSNETTAIENSCFGLKIFWNSMKQWSSLFGYTSISKLYQVKREVWQFWKTSWFKNPKWYSSLNVSVYKNRQFLSNFKDKCVIIEKLPPKEYFNWETPQLSGITLNLGEKPFISINPSKAFEFLELVHSKFNIIEILLPQQDFVLPFKSFQKALGQYKKKQSDQNNKYFLNMGIRERLGFENLVIELSNWQVSVNLTGAHFEFGPNVSTDNAREMVSLTKTMTNKVGFVWEYDCKGFPNLELEQLLTHVDYVIIKLNILRLDLIDQFNMQALSKSNLSHHHKFYNLVLRSSELGNATCHTDFTILFNKIREFRLKTQEISPRVEVLLKIQTALRTGKNPSVTIDDFISFTKFMDEFSSTFNFPFILNEMNDSKTSFGWWRLIPGKENKSEDPSSYVEKMAEFYNIVATLNEEINPIDTSSSEISIKAIVLITLVIGLILLSTTVVAVVTVYFVRKNRKIITALELQEIKTGNILNLYNGENATIEYNEIIELNKNEFNSARSSVIGAGQFGFVYRTHMARFDMEVAVKTPRASENKAEFAQAVKSMVWEIRILSYVGEHENLITLLGAYTKEIQTGNLFFATEFCENGSLLDHLKELNQTEAKNDFSYYELYRFCQEIACGMEYLAGKMVIHGDLSARNVLLGKNKIVKISDFGLSRKLDHYEKYVKTTAEPLPWAWMAIESLQRLEFTIKSDVWSMGVTFWEVFSFGQRPYAGLSLDEEFKEKISNGMRPAKPSRVSNDLYNQMMKCWMEDPESRPNASHFIEYFQRCRASGYEVFEQCISTAVVPDSPDVMETRL